MGELTDELLRSCPLCRWTGYPANCRWCNAELPKRRTRWCSDACSWAWAQQHVWSSARAEALRRTPACRVCGTDGRPIRELSWGRVLALMAPAAPATVWWRLDRDVMGPLYRAHALEVNHIRPILGRHADAGCWHHQDGLEVLCYTHHVQETNRQRAAGELTP